MKYNWITVALILTISGCDPVVKSVTKNNSRSSFVNAAESERMEKVFGQIFGEEKFGDSSSFDSLTIQFLAYEVLITTRNYRDEHDPGHFLYLAVSSLNGPEIVYRDTFDRQNKAYARDEHFSVDIYHDTLYACWLSGRKHVLIEDSFAEDPDRLNIECVELKRQASFFRRTVYTQPNGMFRLAMAYNPFTRSVLLAYNDVMVYQSKYLLLNSIRLTNLLQGDSFSRPESILNEDASEKRYPNFIRADTVLYLSNTTGDTWGMMDHYGKQAIGISVIDKNNGPTRYRILADSLPLTEQILIVKDTVYYHERTNEQTGILKKIALGDLAAFTKQ